MNPARLVRRTLLLSATLVMPVVVVHAAETGAGDARPAAGAHRADAAGSAALGIVDPRDIQIVLVDTDDQIATIHNFGAVDAALDAYRLCTADEVMGFQYTTGGLTGRVIEAGTSFRFHFLNDAPGGDPDAVDVSALGGPVRTPLDNGPYGLALYWQVPFSLGDNMSDYVQWTDSLSNPGNATADARETTAYNSGNGVWATLGDWVITAECTTEIALTGDPDVEAHGSGDYTVNNAFGPCPWDLAEPTDSFVGLADLTELLNHWGSCPAASPCPWDFGDGVGGCPDGVVGLGDLTEMLNKWGPCAE